MHRLSALLLCSLCAAPALLLPWDHTGGRLPLAADCLPEGWRVEDITRAAIPADFPGSTYILAYKRIGDDRPVVADYCLVLTHLHDCKQWSIVSLARNPDDSQAEWQVDMIHYLRLDNEGRPYGEWVWHEECFSSRPSSRDVYRFADKYYWRFTVDSGWRLLAANVCESTWRAVFGEGPSREFCKGLPPRRTRR